MKLYNMRKDDWITKLYYKQLNGDSKYNRNTRKNVSSKKEDPPKKLKPRQV